MRGDRWIFWVVVLGIVLVAVLTIRYDVLRAERCAGAKGLYHLKSGLCLRPGSIIETKALAPSHILRI